jgi:hypothetical protein
MTPITAVMAVAVAVFLISTTYGIATQFGDIKHDIADLSRQVLSITTSVTERVTKLETHIDDSVRDGWDRRDHDLWCARTEERNSKLGWKCADDGKIPKEWQSFRGGIGSN